MATAGRQVLTDNGKRGLLAASGKRALFDAADQCVECCGCLPLYTLVSCIDGATICCANDFREFIFSAPDGDGHRWGGNQVAGPRWWPVLFRIGATWYRMRLAEVGDDCDPPAVQTIDKVWGQLGSPYEVTEAYGLVAGEYGKFLPGGGVGYDGGDPDCCLVQTPPKLMVITCDSFDPFDPNTVALQADHVCDGGDGNGTTCYGSFTAYDTPQTTGPGTWRGATPCGTDDSFPAPAYDGTPEGSYNIGIEWLDVLVFVDWVEPKDRTPPDVSYPDAFYEWAGDPPAVTDYDLTVRCEYALP